MTGLQSGLIMVAGFIGLIGMRIISFFTSKRLNVPQIPSPQWVAHASLWLPMLTAMLMAHNILPGLAALFALAAGVIFTVQVYRWWYKAVLKEPMLGFVCRLSVYRFGLDCCRHFLLDSKFPEFGCAPYRRWRYRRADFGHDGANRAWPYRQLHLSAA